jgi:uncharacterized protein (TIGR02996 family)
MTVHFVYRSPYEGPMGLYHTEFPEATLLDWFRTHWHPVTYDDGADERAAAVLGRDVYGFSSLYNAIAEDGLPPPRSSRQLAGYLEDCLYVEGEVRCSPHLIQALTDDDELQLAYYFFDDDYLEKHADRAALLLHDGWKLPGGEGKGRFKARGTTNRIGPRGRWQGTTYLVFHGFWDSGHLDDLEGAYRIDGVRLPQLAQYLASARSRQLWPPDLELLASELFPRGKKAKSEREAFVHAIRTSPADESGWLIFSDWLAERGECSAGPVILEQALARACRYRVDWNHDPKKSLIHVEEHVAQLCRHVASWKLDTRSYRRHRHDLYHQWIFFDDLWASAEPDLAHAILRYARRWDVLTPR